MANATLMEFFSQYNKDIPPAVQSGVIEEIQYDEEGNPIVVEPAEAGETVGEPDPENQPETSED